MLPFINERTLTPAVSLYTHICTRILFNFIQFNIERYDVIEIHPVVTSTASITWITNAYYVI